MSRVYQTSDHKMTIETVKTTVSGDHLLKGRPGIKRRDILPLRHPLLTTWFDTYFYPR